MTNNFAAKIQSYLQHGVSTQLPRGCHWNTNHSFTTCLNHNGWEPIAFREANVWIRKNKAFMDIFGYSCDKYCLLWGYPCTIQAYPLGGLSTSQGISGYLTSLCISQLRYNHPILSQVPKGRFWNPRAPKPPSHTIWSSGCPPVSHLWIFIDDNSRYQKIVCLFQLANCLPEGKNHQAIWANYNDLTVLPHWRHG